MAVASFVVPPASDSIPGISDLPTVKHGGGNVMVWRCMSGFGRGPIVRIEGIMDAVKYKAILEEHMEPYADAELPLNWQFMQDNDLKHTSRLVREWFEERQIQVMRWSV